MLLNGVNHVAILTHDTDRLVAFYREVFDAEISAHLEELDGAIRLTFIRIGQTAELNISQIEGNTEADRQAPMFGRGPDRPPRAASRLARRVRPDPGPADRPGRQQPLRHRLRPRPQRRHAHIGKVGRLPDIRRSGSDGWRPSLPVKSPRAGHLQAGPCRRGQRRSPRLPPICSNGASDGDRVRQGGGGPYGSVANAVDLACPG